MLTATELFDKRQESINALEEMRRSKPEVDTWSSEDEEKWDRINKDVNAFTLQIQQARTLEQHHQTTEEFGDDYSDVIDRRSADDRRQGRYTEGPQMASSEMVELVIDGYVQRCVGNDPTPMQRAAADNLGVNLAKSFIDLPIPRHDVNDMYVQNGVPKFRDLDTSTTGKGGTTISTGFVPRLELAMKMHGQMRQACPVLRTNTGNTIKYPIANDTANAASIVAERIHAGTGGFTGTSVDPDFDEVELSAFKYGTEMYVSYETIVDNEVGLAELLPQMMGTRIARDQNVDFTKGSGSSEPQGLITAILAADAGSASPLTTGASLTYDLVIDTYHNLDPAYRNGASWMAHDSIWAAVRKIKDSQGQPLWQAGLVPGMPDQLLGAQTWINQDMDSTVAAGNEVLIYGNFGKCIIRDAGTIRFRQSEHHKFQEDQIAFQVTYRSDFKCLFATDWALIPFSVFQGS